MDSSPAPSSPPLKYDVFLSFRAEDTLFFASHLVSGLLKKQLEIFFDIHALIKMEEKDDTVAPEGACLAAIDQSLFSIVILSEKYASSTWCLTELSRILESRRNYGQRVIPVFYKVDPSHVRYQIGRFGDAFHKHEDDLMKVLDLKKVKSDLKEISNISGYDSRFIGSGDSEVVNDVVNKISRWRAEKAVVEIELASVEEKLLAQWRRVKSMIQGMAKLDYGDDQPISALWLHEHQWYLAFLRFYTKGNLRSKTVRPSFFDSLCALQSLALSGTSIKYLPESVFGLANLRVFFAEDCQLCELPENPRSPLLEFLFLRRNWALRKIPPSFFDGMQAVKCLDLSMTGIKSLPVSSLSLPTVEWLWLRHCELCKLPENPNWPVLEGLYLDGNHDLRTIPPSFFDCMPALQILDLSMTGIKSLPNSPFSLPELRSLFLIDCQLWKLPENLMFPELQELSLRGNRQLRTIPPSFFKNMPALFYLCLSKTPIKYLPDSLFCLKQLEVLHLRDCDLLMTLSPRIGELKCLKDLDLEGTEIMHLPEEVKELKHLKALRVSFCELPSYIREKHSGQVIYPGTLSSLSELEELYIDVSPDDERWNQCVEVIVSELSKLFSLKDLRLYVAKTKFLSCFEWEQLEYFDLKVGHHAKRLMPRLPSDAEIELQKYGRRLTYVNGEGESKEINLLLEFTEALFLDRHATIYALSQFEGFNQSLICCVAGECNQLQVLFHGDQMTLVLLEYLFIYYMKSLKSIWEGVIIPHALSHLKSLTLRTCPELTTVFTPALIAGLVSLEELTMVDCPAVTNLVSTNDFKHITFLNEPFIPTLKRISLHDLPELTAIFDLSLSPNLSWISIYHCLNLKSLPIDKVKNIDLKKIEGEMNWWKALEGGKIHQQHPWRDVFKEIVDCHAVTDLVSTNDFKHITFLNEPFISRLKRISLHDLPKLTTLDGRKIHQQHPLTARLERLSLHDLLKLTALEGGEIHQQHPLTARLKRISLHDLPKLTALEGAEVHQQHPLTVLEGGKSINSIHEEATATDRLKALEGGKSINSIHEEATTSIERIGKSISKSTDELIDSEYEADFTLWLTALKGGEIHQQHLLTALEGGKSISSIHEEATTIDRLKALERGKSIRAIQKVMGWFLCGGKSRNFAKKQLHYQILSSSDKMVLAMDVKKEGSKDGGSDHIAAHTFTFRELAAATKNFRADCLLGEGGFGRVYKGKLDSTNKVVAIKQLDRNGLQGNREFLVEVLMLSLLHHPNLVNLIGYCADGDQRLLVYEYMPLGSLEDHIHDLPPDRKRLDWNTRMKIAAGAAKGLEYLHDKANPPVIYRDLKCSNIWLGEGYHPRLSDFGLAKLGPVGDNTHVSTRVMGTYGYCAPEYAMTGQLTLKSDVYSFGVVLLEIITGRKAIDNARAAGEHNLVAWARPLFKDRRKFSQMADPLLQGQFPMRGLYQALAVAAMCVQEQPNMRPLIADVVTALSYLAQQNYDSEIHPVQSSRTSSSTPKTRKEQ